MAGFTVAFPNGETLTSTAQTPASIETLFQRLTAQILGLPVTDSDGNPLPDGSPCWNAVRIGWQEQGEPSWTIEQDICILTAYNDDTPLSHTSDMLYAAGDEKTIIEQRGYTQGWRMHHCFYGPQAFAHAGLVVAAHSLEWVSQFLRPYNIFVIPEWKRPAYVPENFQGQWWTRADIDLRFNEQVDESIVVPSAAGISIELIKENNLTAVVSYPPPQPS